MEEVVYEATHGSNEQKCSKQCIKSRHLIRPVEKHKVRALYASDKNDLNLAITHIYTENLQNSLLGFTTVALCACTTLKCI